MSASSIAQRPEAARSGRWAALGCVTRFARRCVEPSSSRVWTLAVISALVSAPVGAASTTPENAESAEGAARSLPRQFSVEVVAGGVLFADGTRLGAASELGRWAQRALEGGRFSGAVVFGDEELNAPAITEVMDLLRQIGFAEVRRAGRSAPTEISASLATRAPPVVSAGKTPVAPPPPSEPRPPAVTLATVGLHVDGALNREPHRSRLVKVFEREFSAFRRCHERAERHDEGASFGVDLLIPKTGGRAKVRQSRTRLESKPFRSCMLAAFEAIRFAPPSSERAEIVSYSVLFKPNGQ
jgi:hypothetical protein